MKEQDKTTEKELNKMKASNVPDTELQILVIKMLNELRGRTEELSKDFNRESKHKKSRNPRK